jgi:phosphoheptose isomerase
MSNATAHVPTLLSLGGERRTVRAMVDFGESVAVAALTLARRFAAGATMWCVAPQWPEHARHVAVEFVHPVLVGKRALPAVSIESSDPVASLRSLVRSGDVILAVGSSDSSTVVEIMRRAEAWGVTTIWMGTGARPGPRAAAHIIWIDDDTDVDHDHAASPAVHDGRLVLLYHVLWELTHVCFEHPGLLSVESETDCVDEVCITCSDEGRLGEVIAAENFGRARVRTAQGIELIDTTIISAVAPGDLVLIHAGTAISEIR